MLNPADRPPSTATFFPTEPPRVAPEPPRFATKFFEEFSGRQTSLKSFFGGGGRPVAKPSTRSSLVSLSPTPAPGESPVEEREVSLPPRPPSPPSAPVVDESIFAPFSLARAVFASIDVAPAANGSPWNAGASSSQSQKIKGSTAIDVTKEMEDTQADDSPIAHTNGKTKTKSPKPPPIGQTKLSSFFAQPPSKAKRKSPSPTPPPPKRHTSSPISSQRSNIPSRPTRRRSTEDEDALIAQAIAEADADKASKRAATNAEAAPIWSNLFAKKLPPYCSVHHKPCRDYSRPGPFSERLRG